MYTTDEILDSLINGQMSQAKRKFLKSDVSLVDVYYLALNMSNDERLGEKLLYMADSMIDRK